MGQEALPTPERRMGSHDPLAYPFRLSRRRSRVRVASTPPFMGTWVSCISNTIQAMCWKLMAKLRGLQKNQRCRRECG